VISPFRLEVPDEALDDLRDRLGRTRWPDLNWDDGWSRGVPQLYLTELASYWRDEYDWRLHEARLNGFAQFVTEIDGESIHFLHVRSPEPTALPLVMTHGWPGSVAEFIEVIGPLTDPRSHGGDPADAFHVVAPSIPGFGLSGPTRGSGWSVSRIAVAWGELMKRLGYSRYGAQGGDWGSRISWEVGREVAHAVVGVHVNMLVTPEPGRPLDQRQHRFKHELSGYMALQASKPHTVAYALTDSPIGQLAWIVEKFKDWTDSVTVPEDAVSRDQMLTNVMLYWLTRTAASSARIYHEQARAGGFGAPPPTRVPTGVAVFGHDVVRPVRSLAEDLAPIVHWSEFGAGGHFAAMEQPEVLVDDVRTFFRSFR
jgi:epoxide hydrolase